MARDGLTDSLRRYDPTARHLAYNNTLDRTRIELPPSGDPGASGVVQIDTWNWPSGVPVHTLYNKDSVAIWSASGTTPIPVYLDAPIPVAVAVDIDTDSIKIWSASGTTDVPVYLTSDLDFNNDSVSIFSASGASAIETWINNEPIMIEELGLTEKPYVQKRFTYNANDDIETIKEAYITAPSGTACKLSTFSYNTDFDIDYIVESESTW